MAKYNLDSLQKINKVDIIKICQGYKKAKIPYWGLKKSEIIENVLCVAKGEKPPHKDLTKTWAERRIVPHELTHRMKRFCLAYAAAPNIKTVKSFAKEHNLTESIILHWLTWPDIRTQIDKYMHSIQERVVEKIIQSGEFAVEQLIKVAKNKEDLAEKRKAANDILGYAGYQNKNIGSRVSVRNDVNAVAGSNSNSTSVVNNSIYNMSEEDLKKELADLEILEGKVTYSPPEIEE